MAIEWKEDIAFFTELTHEALGLASLTVQFNVFGKGGVDFCQGATETATADIN